MPFIEIKPTLNMQSNSIHAKIFYNSLCTLCEFIATPSYTLSDFVIFISSSLKGQCHGVFSAIFNEVGLNHG